MNMCGRSEKGDAVSRLSSTFNFLLLWTWTAECSDPLQRAFASNVHVNAVM